jgi:hypothetical protein
MEGAHEALDEPAVGFGEIGHVADAEALSLERFHAFP